MFEKLGARRKLERARGGRSNAARGGGRGGSTAVAEGEIPPIPAYHPARLKARAESNGCTLNEGAIE